MSELPRIKGIFAKGEYKLCSDMCKNLLGDEKDDELYLILAKCHFEIAKEKFNAGRLHGSCQEFDVACNYAKNTLYEGGYILSVASVYFEYMMRLSPTLTSDFGYEVYEGTCDAADPFCRYSRALKNFEEGDIELVRSYLKLCGETDKGFSSHIRALYEMSEGDYISAGERLRLLISGDDIDCRVIMYDIFRNLEDCCRENGDYKGAYEYSVGKVELLEHMLTEVNL